LRQHHDDSFVSVEVTQVGFADEDGAEGLIWMKSGDLRMFAMRSFSGEVAIHMKRFMDGDRSSIPSIFNMVEEMAERDGLHLAGVKVYPAGEALRADMQFMGRGKDLLLRGYRASDGIAMALFYDAPILLQNSLLQSERTEDSQP
jgi:bifunctional DNase/RNase